jgi:hypothetical protein
MSPGARLLRLPNHPGTIILEYGADSAARTRLLLGQSDTADTSAPDSEHASACTVAFHGLAALYAWRWHRQSPTTIPPIKQLEQELHDALPVPLRTPQTEGLLDSLAALGRAHHSVTMDGLARLIGTGRVDLTTVEAARVAAWHTGHRIAGDAGEADPKPTAVLPRKRRDTTSRTFAALHNLLAGALHGRRSDAASESETRGAMSDALLSWCQAVDRQPSMADLMARFALALLEHGGQRRETLKSRTIVGYVQMIARPLVRALDPRPLSRSSAVWQSAFVRILAGQAPSRRSDIFGALQRFHWRLSQEFEMPEVDFGLLASLAGPRIMVVDAGFVTASEAHRIGAVLEGDISALESIGASSAEVHAARARQLALQMLQSTALRPGELRGLRVMDVMKASDASLEIRVRQSRIQSLKTAQARRIVRLGNEVAAPLNHAASEWIESARLRSGVNDLATSPFLAHVDSLNECMTEDLLYRRMGVLIRGATGRHEGVTYWLRKSAILRRLEAYQRALPATLWALRDLIAAIGHAC